MNFSVVLQIIYYVLIFLVGAVPTCIALLSSLKKCKEAQTAEEKSSAINDMKDKASQLIVEAEELFRTFDTFAKSQGSSAGAMKKENVLTKLQAFALSKGYEFDSDFWSNEVDAEVAVTKQVNNH